MVISCIAPKEQCAKTKINAYGRDLKTAVMMLREYGKNSSIEDIESRAEELIFTIVVSFTA